MRWIYVSPHLDDAVLSAGGLIHEQSEAGLPVEIWTVMSGIPPSGPSSPFAELLHTRWGFASAGEAVRERRAEDRRAAARLGAAVRHFDFLDCIYRRDPDGSWSYAEVFVPPRETDAGLAAQVADAMAACLEPRDRVVSPLAIGSHVDHLLVRAALESLRRPLEYFADLPYHFLAPREVERMTAGMKTALHPVSPAGLQAWVEGILDYPSQLSSLFESPDAMKSAVSGYASEQGGIRLWFPV